MPASSHTYWDQTRFNETFQRYLSTISRDKFPNAINKKAYFVARSAVGKTLKRDPYDITSALGKVVIATRKDGTTGPVPIGFVVAAIRAGKSWPAAKMARGEKNRRAVSARRAWRKLLKEKFASMVGGRKSAVGFMALGWHSVVMELAPHIRNKSGQPYMQKPAKLRGRPKGAVKLARPGLVTSCTIENTAQSKTEHRAGLLRLGGPGLDAAFVEQTADMIDYLEKEALKEASEQFNREQK